MYRELILKAAMDNAWTQLQKPCPEEEIAVAEKYVGSRFPAELKALLRETNGDRWLLLSAKEIMENVQRNRDILSECFDDPEEFLDVVDRHIFFASNGCGDYYCYRILPNGEADTSKVLLWEHETFESHAVADDIADLIRKYYNGEV